MFEHFTDHARGAMAIANQQARQFNHEFIGTEHIFLGILKESSGAGAKILKKLNVDTEKLLAEVEQLITSGPDEVAPGQLPQTPLAKKVVEYSIAEAQALNHDHTGTEHLLLGLLKEQKGTAARVLKNLSIKIEDVRASIPLRVVNSRVGSHNCLSNS